MSKPVFDTSTGILTIDSVDVGPGFSRSELWSSPIGPKLEELASNEPYHSLKAAVQVGGRCYQRSRPSRRAGCATPTTCVGTRDEVMALPGAEVPVVDIGANMAYP